MRELGYCTTNNSKTDYNFPVPITAWDDSSRAAHWKNRPHPDQPFISVFNFGSSHEGSVRRQHAARAKDRDAAIHDSQGLPLPPYYPDTPKVREAWGAYYDVVTITNHTIGEMLRQLEEAGLSDETLVVFWGDHGASLARAKRWIYNSGLKVPLIMRWPGKIEPGTIRTDLVQFLDLAPTMISVAGGTPPAQLHARVLLGEDRGSEPHSLYHGRERMDERYDMIRGIRDKRYPYVRNFESHRPWVQFMHTPSQGPICQELERLKADGGLGPLTSPFMRDTKSYEELYDVVADPHQVRNLATDPRFATVLSRLRNQLVDWMKRTNDQGLVPELARYRHMYPNGTREMTADPLVRTRDLADGSVLVSLEPQTEGSSLAYQFLEADHEGELARWLLYRGEIRLACGKALRAIAVRLGFDNSPPVTVKN